MKTNTYIVWPRPEPEVKPSAKSKRADAKKIATRKEKSAQALVEERRLFWKRLRKAITGDVVWEPDIGGGGGSEGGGGGGVSSKVKVPPESSC